MTVEEDHSLQDYCCWKRCRRDSEAIYFDVGLCHYHWSVAVEESEKRKVETRKVVYHNIPPKAQRVMRECYSILRRQRGQEAAKRSS